MVLTWPPIGLSLIFPIRLALGQSYALWQCRGKCRRIGEGRLDVVARVTVPSFFADGEMAAAGVFSRLAA